MENVRVEEGRNDGTKGGRRCNFWCVAAIFFLIGIVGLVAVIVFYLSPSCVRLQYGIIMDAGSTHTSMSIFRWAGEKLKGTGEVIEIISCDVDGPGISSYAQDPPGAGNSLKKCLADGKRKVPKDRHAVTPIYLGATAGMRILKQSDPVAAEKVFKSVEDTFKESKFKYADGNVRMVRDEEEGIYAWVASNLVDETLGQLGERVETSGALDLGGASTQIAFETTERKPGAADLDYANLRLYGFDYNIFTHSYLCFGQRQFGLRINAQILLNNPGAQSFENPCFHKGNNQEENAADIFDQSCTVPFPKTAAFDKNTKISFKSTGNTAECRKLVEQLLDTEQCKKTGYTECFDNSFVPTPKGKFFAMSSLFYVSDQLDAIEGTYEQYLNKTKHFCEAEWSEVQKWKGTDKFKAMFCYTAVYSAYLLGEKYGFKDNWSDLKFVHKVKGVSMGWALGFMTNATNAIPTEKQKAMGTDLFIALVILFVVLLIIVLILSYRGWLNRRAHSSRHKSDNPVLALCCPRKY